MEKRKPTTRMRFPLSIARGDPYLRLWSPHSGKDTAGQIISNKTIDVFVIDIVMTDSVISQVN